MQAEDLSPGPSSRGSKRIHVMPPLSETVPLDTAHGYAGRLVAALAEQDLQHYILSAKAAWRGRFSYLRNERRAPTIGTYWARMRRFPDRSACYFEAD